MPLLTPENRGRYSAGFSLACCYAGRDKVRRKNRGRGVLIGFVDLHLLQSSPVFLNARRRSSKVAAFASSPSERGGRGAGGMPLLDSPLLPPGKPSLPISKRGEGEGEKLRLAAGESRPTRKLTGQSHTWLFATSKPCRRRERFKMIKGENGDGRKIGFAFERTARRSRSSSSLSYAKPPQPPHRHREQLQPPHAALRHRDTAPPSCYHEVIQSDIEEVAIRMKEEFSKYGKGKLAVENLDKATGWLKENPLGIQSDWEHHVLDRGHPMYRLCLSKSERNG
nr:uncharacterized protein LOC109182250 [Ipomoea trifida]